MDPKPTWPPAKLPPKFPLTAYKDGYCKTINGKWRHICGRLSPAKAQARYLERLQAGDFNRGTIKVQHGSRLTVKMLANLYMRWLQERVGANHKKKLQPRTFADYKMALQAFVNTPIASTDLRMADMRVAELAPEDFAAFVPAIPGKSPYTRSRYVAAIKAMFKWAGTNGHIHSMPIFGTDFAKATKDELSDARADLTKSLEPAELRTILATAGVGSVWWPMILLGLNGAFSNIELARLRRSQVDLQTGIVQTTRGKKGRARRKTVLDPATIAALQAYQRPDPRSPEFADFFFLTRNGIPYVRHQIKRDAAGNISDSLRRDTISTAFGKLLADAGVPRDGRSFSALRTTFRTEAEALDPQDNDAVDLIQGHPRKHISAEYVEKFPVHRLARVVQFVFAALFAGWSMPWPRQVVIKRSALARRQRRPSSGRESSRPAA